MAIDGSLADAMQPLASALGDWAREQDVPRLSLAALARTGETWSMEVPATAPRPNLFFTGSQSKTLSAFVIAKILSERAVSLDQPVAHWWARAGELLPHGFGETSAAALLSHRSCGFALEEARLRRPDKRHLPLATPVRANTLAPYLRSYRGRPRRDPPEFEYSDIAYALLALAIEEGLEVSFDDAMAECIETFGQPDMFFGYSNVPQDRKGDVAPGIASFEGTERLAEPCDLGSLNCALGLVASAQSMARLYSHLLTDKAWLQTCAGFARLISPQRDHREYSLGLTHFGEGAREPASHGHVGIYNGCTGATIVCSKTGLALSLQLNRISLRTGDKEPYRMIYPERFLFALRNAISDCAGSEGFVTQSEGMMESLVRSYGAGTASKLEWGCFPHLINKSN